MKKLLLCLLLCTAMAQAQNVNIPDAGFKSILVNSGSGVYLNVAKNQAGNTIAIDANGDGEIQLSEAAAVWQLALGSGDYSSIQGVEAFFNTRIFKISNSPLTSFDVSALINLTELYAGLNLQLNTINLGDLPNLQVLDCEGNHLTNLDMSGLPHLVRLNLKYNYLTSIDLSSPTTLERAVLGNNPMLTSVNFSGCDMLFDLWLDNIPLLESADLSNLSHLSNLVISCPSLSTLTFGYHPSSDPQFQSFYIRNTKLTSLDLSGFINTTGLDLSNNPFLSYLNLKNGPVIMNQIDVSGCAPGVFICVDEGEEPYFQRAINNGANVSSYCSFVPGGSYNTITGVAYFDVGSDGCDASDRPIPFEAVHISYGTSTGAALSTNGSYHFYVPSGSYTLTPQFESSWFTASPQVVAFPSVGATVTQDFCVTSNGIHPDAEITVVPLSPVMPGFNIEYQILYKNKGNQVLSGNVVFDYDGNVQTPVFTYPAETTSSAGHFTWTYANLLPFESRIIYVILNTNSPSETPAVNIGDYIIVSANISPSGGDETPGDNAFELSQQVVSSFDPNNIICLEGSNVDPVHIGEYLHYNVNFENTGTAPATFVVVKDVIDPAKYDIASLQVLNASHALETRITGNKVEFIFDNIDLEANGGKGNVTFKIKSLNTLAVNSSVMQKADIFFDYNWPIVTNEATTTFAVLNAGGFTKDDTVKVYPNPAKNSVIINAETAIRSIQLFDVQGRLLEATSENDINAKIDISSRANGIYFIKVATDKGMKVEKVIKQ